MCQTTQWALRILWSMQGHISRLHCGSQPRQQLGTQSLWDNNCALPTLRPLSFRKAAGQRQQCC